MIRSRRGGRHHRNDTAELNITAFMNLMVILVPFLLITAVFSRLAILELNLPGSSSEPVASAGTVISTGSHRSSREDRSWRS